MTSSSIEQKLQILDDIEQQTQLKPKLDQHKDLDIVNESQQRLLNKTNETNIPQVSQVSYRFSMIGFIWIIVSVVTTAAILPFSVALPLKSTLLKLSWRNMTMIPFLFVMCIYEIKTKYKTFKLTTLITQKQMILDQLYLGSSFLLIQIGYIISGQYTIMSHASILSNLGGVFIVVFRVLRGKSVHKLEYVGLVIAFVGTIVSVMDKEVQKVDSANQRVLLGDICGILTSIAASSYYQKNAEFVQTVPSSIAVCITIIISETLLIVYGLIFDTFTFDFSKQTGVFGFFDPQYVLYTIFIVGMITGSVSIYSAAVVLKYYPPVVLLIAYLFEPLISQLISCMMNIDRAPGLLTYLGGFFTLIGILAVTYGGNQLEKLQQNKNKNEKEQELIANIPKEQL
eukprot:403358284